MDEENKKNTSTSEETTQTQQSEVKGTPKIETNKEKPKKNNKGGLIVSIVIILLAVIGGAIGGAIYATVFARTEVDLSKYVTIEFEGYEGYASFDENDLIIDEKGLKKVLENKKLASKLATKITDKAEVKENEGIKNGDEIEVNFKISEDWLKENKIKLTSNTIKLKVKDLEKTNSIDLFEDLEFSYSGISPDLTVTLKNNSSDNFIKNKVSFSMETSKASKSSYSLYDIANGDKITVTATYSQSDLESAGYVIEEDEYTFTVEGQAEYVRNVDSITSEIKNAVESKLSEKAKSLANTSSYDIVSTYHEDFYDINHYDYKLTNADPVLEKMYIAINNKEDIGYYDSRNIVYAVYKVTFTDTTTSKTYDYYITTDVEDLVVSKNDLSTEKSYYYEEFYNNNYSNSDYKKSVDETYKAIQDKLGENYTLTELK